MQCYFGYENIQDQKSREGQQAISHRNEESDKISRLSSGNISNLWSQWKKYEWHNSITFIIWFRNNEELSEVGRFDTNMILAECLQDLQEYPYRRNIIRLTFPSKVFTERLLLSAIYPKLTNAFLLCVIKIQL